VALVPLETRRPPDVTPAMTAREYSAAIYRIAERRRAVRRRLSYWPLKIRVLLRGTPGAPRKNQRHLDAPALRDSILLRKSMIRARTCTCALYTSRCPHTECPTAHDSVILSLAMQKAKLRNVEGGVDASLSSYERRHYVPWRSVTIGLFRGSSGFPVIFHSAPRRLAINRREAIAEFAHDPGRHSVCIYNGRAFSDTCVCMHVYIYVYIFERGK